MNPTRILIAFGLFLLAGFSYGQEFKLSKTSGRLEIYLSNVMVEGYNGNEIIFTSLDQEDRKKDERAKGLTAINSLGLTDNTGLGISVVDNGNAVVVHQLKKLSVPHIKIQVPRGVIVSYNYQSQYGKEVEFKNMSNEIEVSAQYNDIKLVNVTGPLTAKTMYGSIEADFSSEIKEPISIVSVYGFVDVTIPQATKADLELSTSYGEIYVDSGLKIEIGEKSEMTRISDRVRGKLNGGGLSISLKSNYGNVYLRKK